MIILPLLMLKNIGLLRYSYQCRLHNDKLHVYIRVMIVCYCLTVSLDFSDHCTLQEYMITVKYFIIDDAYLMCSSH